MSQLELAFIILGTIFIIMSSLQIAKEHKKSLQIKSQG